MRLLKLPALAVLALAAISLPATAAEKTKVTLGTATPGGGFQLFGAALAPVINATDPTLELLPQDTKGSGENLKLLAAGKLDTALVAGVPAYEALAGQGREKVDLKIIGAIYSSFGMFAVKGDSLAKTYDDLIGKKVAWGTSSSGLTSLGGYVAEALGLDKDKDFQAVYLEKAGQGTGLVLKGEVAAQWGGGIGWPNFTKITEAGGRLIGLTPAQVTKVNAKFPFLKPYTLAPGSYPGQTAPVLSVAAWSYILARKDLPDDIAYRLAKALHKGNKALVEKLDQGRETTPENTRDGALEPGLIHPGVQKYLTEIGL